MHVAGRTLSGRPAATKFQDATHYFRYRSGPSTAYGILDGGTVRELPGSLFDRSETGTVHPLAAVRLLAPVVPGKILAVGLNYRSHLGARPQPEFPEIFYKPPSALRDPDGPIALPPGSTGVHYEGGLAVVLGKPVKHATPEQARDAIFGVTCGNDVSERQWQHGAARDLQWWRAKGCDTFAPPGPAIVTGLGYIGTWVTLNPSCVGRIFPPEVSDYGQTPRPPMT